MTTMILTASVLALISGRLRSLGLPVIAGVLMFIGLTGCAGSKATIDAKQELNKPVSVSAHYEWSYTR